VFTAKQIDDEADAAGIKFVKVEDSQLAREYGVFALPSLVFFKHGEDVPVIFAGEWGFVYLRPPSSAGLLAGDFKKAERILEWLINQKDPTRDTIEEVDAGALRKLIDTADHLAVYFCKYCNLRSHIHTGGRGRKNKPHSPDSNHTTTKDRA